MKFAIEREAAAGDVLKTALVNEREELAKVERRLRAAIKAGDEESEALARQSVELRGNVQRLQEKTRAESHGTEQSVNFAKAIAGVTAAAAAAAAGAFLLTKRVAENGDEMIKSAQRLGLTAEQFQRFNHAMKISGTSMEESTGALDKMRKSARDAAAGVSKQVEAFAALGVSATNADGSLKNTDELLRDLADGFRNTDAGTQRAAAAMDIFGTSGTKLTQFLSLGSAGVTQLGDEIQALGGVMSTSGAQASERFNDALLRMNTAAGGIVRTLGETFQPVITRVMEQASVSIGRLRQVYAPVFQGLVDFAVQAGQMIVPALTFMAQAFVGVATTVQLAWNGLLYTINKVAGGILDNINRLIEGFNRVLPASKQIETWMNPFKSTAESISEDMGNIIAASAATIEEIENIGDAILGVANTRLTVSTPSIEAETQALETQRVKLQEVQVTETARADNTILKSAESRLKQIEDAEALAEAQVKSAAQFGASMVGAYNTGNTAAEGFKNVTKAVFSQVIDTVRDAAIKSIMAHAATGAVKAASSQAAVPIVGPALAAAAAGAMFALLSGFVNKFNKGGIVPGVGSRDTVPAMLTPGEIVLPAGLSKMLLDVVGRSGSGAMQDGGVVAGSGGGVVVNFNENSITPRTPAELDRFVRDRLVPTMQRLRRQGVAI